MRHEYFKIKKQMFYVTNWTILLCGLRVYMASSSSSRLCRSTVCKKEEQWKKFRKKIFKNEVRAVKKKKTMTALHEAKRPP